MLFCHPFLLHGWKRQVWSVQQFPQEHMAASLGQAVGERCVWEHVMHGTRDSLAQSTTPPPRLAYNSQGTSPPWASSSSSVKWVRELAGHNGLQGTF